MKCSVKDCDESAVSPTAGKCPYHLYAEVMGREAAERQREAYLKAHPQKRQKAAKP